MLFSLHTWPNILFLHFFRKSQLCFIWDPLLELISDQNFTFIQTQQSILVKQPEVILLGAGLWHLATKMNFAQIEKLFKSLQINLQHRSEKVIFQLQTKSLFYEHGIYNDMDIQKLNSVVQNVFKNSSKVLIFDSHLPIYNDYSNICRTFFDHFISAPPSSLWQCKDPNHSPFLLTKHYVKLILFHICTLWSTNQTSMILQLNNFQFSSKMFLLLFLMS